MKSDRPGRASGEGEGLGLQTHSRLYTNYTAAAVTIALSAAAFLLSLRVERVPTALAQGIQPASFPQGVIIAILIFTLIMLVETRNEPLEEPEPVPGLAYKTMAAMVASLAVTTWVDFFGGLIGFVMICVPMWGGSRWGLAAGYALILHAILFLLFSTLLQVRFPHGPLSSLFY
jgi:putative tricarboxylic transport membrane protein